LEDRPTPFRTLLFSIADLCGSVMCGSRSRGPYAVFKKKYKTVIIDKAVVAELFKKFTWWHI
jgi:hypothetical protein